MFRINVGRDIVKLVGSDLGLGLVPLFCEMSFRCSWMRFCHYPQAEHCPDAFEFFTIQQACNLLHIVSNVPTHRPLTARNKGSHGTCWGRDAAVFLLCHYLMCKDIVAKVERYDAAVK